jgi:hypothetical protein
MHDRLARATYSAPSEQQGSVHLIVIQSPCYRRTDTHTDPEKNRLLPGFCVRTVNRQLSLLALRALAHWCVPVAASLSRAGPDNALVHSCFDAVVLLDVQLWQSIVLVDRGLADVTQRGGIHNVPVRKVQ